MAVSRAPQSARAQGETPSAVVASVTLKPARITLLIADMVMYSSSSNSDFTVPEFSRVGSVSKFRLNLMVPLPPSKVHELELKLVHDGCRQARARVV